MGKLENVKIGDKLIYTTRTGESVVPVISVTTHHVVVLVGQNKRKFKRKNGTPVNVDPWATDNLSMATPEELIKVRNKNARQRIIVKFTSKEFLKRIQELPIERLKHVELLLFGDIANELVEQQKATNDEDNSGHI